jgi:hypothetical protein
MGTDTPLAYVFEVVFTPPVTSTTFPERYPVPVNPPEVVVVALAKDAVPVCSNRLDTLIAASPPACVTLAAMSW